MHTLRCLTFVTVASIWLTGGLAGAQTDRVPGPEWTKLSSPEELGWSSEGL